MCGDIKSREPTSRFRGISEEFSWVGKVVGKFLDGKIVEVVEKPANPPSDLACVGFYMYASNAFEQLDKLVPSPRGELEVTDLNQWYISRNVCNFGIVNGWWTDAGTFESYGLANKLVGE